MKEYCFADSLSPYQPKIKNGEWTMLTDSLLKFSCVDKSTFNATLINDSTIQLIPEKGKEKFNYPYKRDTTKNEMFWQRVNK